MSFDILRDWDEDGNLVLYKVYPNRKDWRRQYRDNDARCTSTSCRSHGGCPYCMKNRTRRIIRNTPLLDDDDISLLTDAQARSIR